MIRSDGSPRGDGFTHSRLWDLVAGSPCILFNAFAAGGFAILVGRALHQRVGLTSGLGILSESGSFVFFSMEAVLVCIRRLPRQKYRGLLPRMIALVAAYFPFALVLLPRAAPSIPLAAASTTLLLIGTAGGIVTLTYLGRSFAILPQARHLITNGPYQYVRHPLYLFGQVSLIGVSLQFQQPWASAVALIALVLQFPRMALEEEILRQTFPEYACYQARTPLLLPHFGKLKQ
jgi:protein-S-isoprenylcysteine O-methyltransferase Ste14